MSEANNQVTTHDALKSLEEANKITANSMRPPLWLILLCAVALGIKTTAMGLMLNNSLWDSIQWGSYIVICFSMAFWIAALRIKGITIRIVDVKVSIVAITSALLICTLILLARAIYLHTGSVLIPYVAGALNTLILAFGLHFGLRLNAKEKEKNNG